MQDVASWPSKRKFSCLIDWIVKVDDAGWLSESAVGASAARANVGAGCAVTLLIARTGAVALVAGAWWSLSEPLEWVESRGVA